MHLLLSLHFPWLNGRLEQSLDSPYHNLNLDLLVCLVFPLYRNKTDIVVVSFLDNIFNLSNNTKVFMLRQRHNYLLVSKMEIDCLICSSGRLILDIEGKAACENCGVEVPPDGISGNACSGSK